MATDKLTITTLAADNVLTLHNRNKNSVDGYDIDTHSRDIIGSTTKNTTLETNSRFSADVPARIIYSALFLLRYSIYSLMNTISHTTNYLFCLRLRT